MASKTAVIAGATGIVGRGLIDHLRSTGDWNIVSVSRRESDLGPGVRHVQADLLDKDASSRQLSKLSDATHIFYTAYAPRPTWAEEVGPNVSMLVNLVETLEGVAPNLAHVQLMQGTKWYGNHLGPFSTPARETDPRHLPPNFYYDQQDWLVERQRGKRWSWSALRPHCIMGFAAGSPMNHLMGLAIYSVISRELGLPLRWPGHPAAFASMYNFTDARLLGRAMEWAATTQACENEAFNMTNGDVDRWERVWPEIVEIFGMEAGRNIQQVNLQRMMADKEPLWAGMREKYGLQSFELKQLVSWPWADWAYSTPYDQVSSIAKARRAGWTAVQDTGTMFRELIGGLVDNRIIPPAPGPAGSMNAS